MFCQVCGTKREGTEKFCANCGSAFHSETETPKSVNVSKKKKYIPKEDKNAEKTVNGFAKFFKIAGVIFLVFCIFMGVYRLVNYDFRRTEDDKIQILYYLWEYPLRGVIIFILTRFLWAMLAISAKISSMLVDIKYAIENQTSDE